MSAMALTADHVIVVGRGRLLRDQSMAEVIAASSHDLVRVRTPEVDRLVPLLAGPHVSVTRTGDNGFDIEGRTTDHIGTVAAAAGVTLFELSPQSASLEEASMALTEESVDFRSTDSDSTEVRAA